MPPSNNLGDETRLKAAQKLPGRKLAGETVVVDPKTRRVFLLNTVGGVVWAGVERGASVGEIRAEIVKRFRVSDAQARADLEKFVGELEAAGLAEAERT
jgi:hypothetical protein